MLNRAGAVTISKQDFQTLKDATTLTTTTYATTVGTALWTNAGAGTTFNSEVLKETIAGAETNAIKNVTSIDSFDPAAAMGDTICNLFTTIATCGQDTTVASMASICEWVGGACTVKTTTIDLCGLPATVTSLTGMTELKKAWHCTHSSKWCKWDPNDSTCKTKTPGEVQEAESVRTRAPSPAPTSQPTRSNTVDFCKICLHSELKSAVLDSAVCREYAFANKCDQYTDMAYTTSGAMVPPVPTPYKCQYEQITSMCPGLVMCASHCKMNGGIDNVRFLHPLPLASMLAHGLMSLRLPVLPSRCLRPSLCCPTERRVLLQSDGRGLHGVPEWSVKGRVLREPPCDGHNARLRDTLPWWGRCFVGRPCLRPREVHRKLGG